MTDKPRQHTLTLTTDECRMLLPFVDQERSDLMFSAETSADFKELEFWNRLVNWLESVIVFSDSEF